MTPVKAIRAKCLDCCCGSTKEVRLARCMAARSTLSAWVTIQIYAGYT